MSKTGKRIVSLWLAVLLGVGALAAGAPPMRITAYAAPPAPAAHHGVVLDSSMNFYYGTYDHAERFEQSSFGPATKEGQKRPVLWRVAGEEAEKTVALSEYVLDSAIFNNNGSNHVYHTSPIKSTLATMSGDIFSTAEAGCVQQTDVITGMYDQKSGIAMNGNQFGTNYPVTTTDQALYLPWGKMNDAGVYWSAGNDPSEGRLSQDAAGNIAKLKGGSTVVNYWLRTPGARHIENVLSVHTWIGTSGLGAILGIRPAFQFDLASVIFTSKIVADATDKPWTTEADGANYTAAGSRENYKLTILNTDVKLNSLTGTKVGSGAGETLTIAPGGTLDLTGTVGGGADKLVYKIVDNSSGTIVGYGTGDTTNLTVKGTANVTDNSDLLTTGSYTLYVWAQKDNAYQSHEGSTPLYFTLHAQVASSDATLQTVAGKTFTAGSQAGTDVAPKTAAITVENSRATIQISDIVSAAGATAKLYSDAGFLQDENQPIPLTEGSDTDIYIKVTAQDNVTVLHYKVTVTREDAPRPAVTTLELGTMFDDTVEEGQLYFKTIPVTYQNGTATELDYTFTGLPSGLNDISLGFSGAISGTPDIGTAASSPYTVHVEVTDGTLTNSSHYTLTVIDSTPTPIQLTLAQPDNATAKVGEPFIKTLSVTYTGNETLGYSATGLPDGLEIDQSNSAISGTPTQAGSYAVTATVSEQDGGALTDSANFTITIQGSRPLPRYTVTFDPAGGIRTGGGGLSQSVEEGQAAIAPIVKRVGYTFFGWDRDFSNVTGDMTVRALWTESTQPPSLSSRGSDSGSTDTAPPLTRPTVYIIHRAEMKRLIAIADKNGWDFARSSCDLPTIVKGDAWELLGERNFAARTTIDNVVQVQLTFPQPGKLTTDMQVSGYVNGGVVNRPRAFFEKWYRNKLKVIHLAHTGSFGLPVEIAAKADLDGMDTANLFFYSYDNESNGYRLIEKPAYWIDRNGYLHFTTELAGDIIISDGKLEQK